MAPSRRRREPKRSTSTCCWTTLGQVTSPSQLAPLARAIQSAAVTAAQRQILWARFGGLLESMQPDDRSFAASLPALDEPRACRRSKPRSTSSSRRTTAARPISRLRLILPRRPRKQTTPKLDLYWQSANRQAIAPGRPEAALQIEQRTADRCRSRHARVAAAAVRLSESDRGLDARSSRNQTPSTITRSASSYTALLDLVPSGSAERHDPGRLCRFHQQFRPLSAKPGRVVRGTAHRARSLPGQFRAAL